MRATIERICTAVLAEPEASPDHRLGSGAATQPIYADVYWQGLRWLNGDEP